MDHSCKLPWTWLVVNLDQNVWRFCCKTDWQMNFNETYNEHNKTLLKVRQEFLDGGKPKECRSCWREESLNGASYRTTITGATKKELLPTYKGLEYIDLIYGSLCNLRCASCGPFSSTQWSSLLKQQDTLPFLWLTPLENTQPNVEAWKRIPQIIEENILSLDHLNLYGGEPSIDPNFIQLIDQLCDMDISARKNNPIALRIYTNGVWPDNDKLSEKFLTNLYKAKAKGWKVDLKFSIDAIGENAEYIRHPTKWSNLDKHLDMMVAEGFTDQIHITTSLLNLPVQHEIIEYFSEKSYRDKVRPIPNLANRPEIIAVANLGSKVAEMLKPWNNVPDLPLWKHYKRWITGIGRQQANGITDSQRLKIFIEYTDRYAKVNNTTIPADLKKFYNSYLE